MVAEGLLEEVPGSEAERSVRQNILRGRGSQEPNVVVTELHRRMVAYRIRYKPLCYCSPVKKSLRIPRRYTSTPLYVTQRQITQASN